MTGGEHKPQSLKTMMSIARALATLSPRRTATALSLALAGAVVEGLGLLLLAPILSVVAGGGPAWIHRIAGEWGIVGKSHLIAALMLVFVILMIVRGVVLYARDVSMQALQARFVDAQRLRVLQALAVAPWHEVAALDHARTTNLIGVDVIRVGGTAQQMTQLVISLISTAMQLSVVAVLSPGLAAVAAVGMALGGGVALFRQHRAHRTGATALVAGQKMMGNAASFLGGLKIAAAQAMRERFVTEFSASQDNVRRRNLEFQRDQARTALWFALGSAVALALVVVAGINGLGIAPARLGIVIFVFMRMVGPVQSINQSLQSIAYGLPAYEAIEDAERRFTRSPDPAASPPPAGPIVLDRVVYWHLGGGGVGEASLTIGDGHIVGLTGASGGGKTTLVDLITGLLMPQSGSVSVGGRALVGGWGGAVAYVPQDGFLFHDSIRRNLDWGDPGIDEAAMRAAIDAVGARGIVARMDKGLDTVVGERGALLSGGERQRLAIARGLLRKPRLLILDEATNAIDQASEADLLAQLAALDPRPTILIVAHRESSLRLCDMLIHVENGVATVTD